MRIASPGHAVFALTFVALAILGMFNSHFAAVWQPIPKGTPGGEVPGYLCTLLSLACGTGLLVKPAAPAAARVLLLYLLFWSLLMNVPGIYRAHAAFGSWYGLVEAAVMVAGALVLYAWFAADRHTPRIGRVRADVSLRIARTLYGVAMLYFGAAHFVYLKQTVADVPAWLPSPAAWAYLTGATFIAAGVAILAGIYARLAAALSALQIGLFVLLVWVPTVLAAGPKTSFQWSEAVISAALTAGAWMLADSYRGTPWLAAMGAGVFPAATRSLAPVRPAASETADKT